MWPFPLSWQSTLNCHCVATWPTPTKLLWIDSSLGITFSWQMQLWMPNGITAIGDTHSCSPHGKRRSSELLQKILQANVLIIFGRKSGHPSTLHSGNIACTSSCRGFFYRSQIVRNISWGVIFVAVAPMVETHRRLISPICR